MRLIMVPLITLLCIRPMPMAHSTATTPMTANTMTTTLRGVIVVELLKGFSIFGDLFPVLALVFAQKYVALESGNHEFSG